MQTMQLVKVILNIQHVGSDLQAYAGLKTYILKLQKMSTIYKKIKS